MIDIVTMMTNDDYGPELPGIDMPQESDMFTALIGAMKRCVKCILRPPSITTRRVVDLMFDKSGVINPIIFTLR